METIGAHPHWPNSFTSLSNSYNKGISEPWNIHGHSCLTILLCTWKMLCVPRAFNVGHLFVLNNSLFFEGLYSLWIPKSPTGWLLIANLYWSWMEIRIAWVWLEMRESVITREPRHILVPSPDTGWQWAAGNWPPAWGDVMLLVDVDDQVTRGLGSMHVRLCVNWRPTMFSGPW